MESVFNADMDRLFKIKWIAELAHETNRAYCEMLGDFSHLPWKDAPEWARVSAIDGVKRHLNNPSMTPEQSHQAWIDFKKKDGWVWGPNKDPMLKQHPCLVPYADLAVAQRMKDYVFTSVVRALDRMWEG